MKVKQDSEKVDLKLNIQKTKIMASSPITSWQINGETMETVRDFIFLGSKITADGDCSHQIKRHLLLGRKVMTNFSSVAQSCPTLCDPMNRNTPGLPVHHKLPEFTQTHVHRVSDAIQPSHPLASPSPPALNPSQHQSLFQWVSSSHEVAKVLEFQLQHHSLQRNPRADLLQNRLVGSPCNPRDSQESSPTPQFKSINSLAPSLLHSPTLDGILKSRDIILPPKVHLVRVMVFPE